MQNYQIVGPLEATSGALGPPPLLTTRYDGYVTKYHVIKLIPLSRIDSYQMERAKFELNYLSNLDHPNLIPILEYFTAGLLLHIAMDYLQMDHLGKVITTMAAMNQQFPEKHIIKWVTQIALALEYFHRLKPPIIHGHLRPENIFLAPDGVKLCELGFGAWVYNSANSEPPKGHAVCYAAPECFTGKFIRLTPKSDVWSLGVIAYEMANLKKPFKDLGDVVLGSNPPLSKNYFPDFERLLRWMVEKTPDRRPTMAQVLNEPIISKGKPFQPITPIERFKPRLQAPYQLPVSEQTVNLPVRTNEPVRNNLIQEEPKREPVEQMITKTKEKKVEQPEVAPVKEQVSVEKSKSKKEERPETPDEFEMVKTKTTKEEPSEKSSEKRRKSKSKDKKEKSKKH